MSETSPRSSYQPQRKRGVNDLIAKIDHYLATQLSYEFIKRPTSAGTMFVDFNSSGDMEISYRNRRRSPPPPLAQDMHVHYNPHAAAQGRCSMYVEGCDPPTRFEYDYDGSVMPLHRDGLWASSRHSDYCAVDAEQYDPCVPFLVEEGEAERYMPASECRKRGHAVRFIHDALKWVEGLGIMKRFREERTKWRQVNSRKRKRASQRQFGARVPRAYGTFVT